VEDVPTLVALTQSRRFNTVQRMFPLVISNPGNQPASYCLKIMNQPADYLCTSAGSCSPARASFDPLPAFNYFDQFGEAPRRTLLEVPVAGQSSAARSAFVTSSDASTIIRVNAYEGSCPADGVSFGGLVSTVELSDGKLFDPVFCEGKTDPTSPDYDPACDSVENAEAHNISLASPGLQAPILQAPGLQAPGCRRRASRHRACRRRPRGTSSIRTWCMWSPPTATSPPRIPQTSRCSGSTGTAIRSS
jgi:hypothetical protein